MNCTFCDGPWHPATGAYISPRARACGPCERRFWVWVRSRQYGRSPSFANAASLWHAEVAQAERESLARKLLEIWGGMPHYRGTISLVQRLARLTLNK